MNLYVSLIFDALRCGNLRAVAASVVQLGSYVGNCSQNLNKSTNLKSNTEQLLDENEEYRKLASTTSSIFKTIEIPNHYLLQLLFHARNRVSQIRSIEECKEVIKFLN
jgi:hypothetical protein